MNPFCSTLRLARQSFSDPFPLAGVLAAGLVFAALASPSIVRAQVPSGLYSGTMHSYCPSFDYHDELVLAVYADGTATVSVPSRGGSFDSSGTVAADKSVGGLSIQVNSLSRGHLVIPYTLRLQADNTLAGSGVSGDIKLDVTAAKERSFTPTVGITVATATGTAQSSEVSVVEGKTKPTLIVTRYGEDLTAPVKVTYKSKGSAKPGVNYKPLKGSVTIPAGQASSKFKLTTLNDEEHTGTKTLQLILAAGVNGSYIVSSDAKVKINILDQGK